MHYPPTTHLLSLHQPPPMRPVYDIPPVIVVSPRWPGLRTLAKRLARRRRTAITFRAGPVSALSGGDRHEEKRDGRAC
jgi:hypothetical protein